MPTQNIPAPTAAECLHLSVSILGCRASRKINTSFCKPGAPGPACAQHLFPHSVSQVSQGGTRPLSLGERPGAASRVRAPLKLTGSTAAKSHSPSLTRCRCGSSCWPNLQSMCFGNRCAVAELALLERSGGCTGTFSLGETGCPGERKAAGWRWAEQARGNMTAVKGPGILS